MDENIMNTVPSKAVLLNKVSYWVLLVVTALLPVFFLPISSISTQFGTSLLFSFGVIISAILYIVSGISSGSLDLPKPAKYVLGFLALVPAVYFLAGISNGFSRQVFFGYTFDISTVGFMLLSFVYLFLVSILFNDSKKIVRGFMAFGLSAIVFAIFALLRILTKGSILGFGIFPNITTTMLGSWHNVAILFSVSGLLSLFTLEMNRGISKMVKIMLYVGLVVSLFFIALVNFGAVWAILGLTSFLFILFRMFSLYSSDNDLVPITWSKRFQKIPKVSTVVFILSIVFFIGANSFGTFLANKFGAVNVEVRPTFASTMEIAKNTIKEKPLFGSGPNTFVTQWLAHKPADVVTTVFWNIDFANGIGLIPTFSVTTGIIGIISWLLFLGFYVYLGIKSIFIRQEDGFNRYLVISTFFVSLFIWMVNFVYVPSTAMFVLTFLFTGLFLASVYISGIIPVVNRKFNTNAKLGFISSLIMVTSLVAVVSLGYGLYKNSMSLWYFQKSSYALNTENNSKLAEEYMLRAILAVPSDVYYRSLSEIQIYKLNELLSQDLTKVDREKLQQEFSDGLANAIKSAISAKDKDESNYQNWISLGRVYDAVSNPQLNITGAYESAQLAYAEAFKRNPKNPGILMLAARMAANRNDLTTAETYATQATQIKNNYLDAYFLLSQIEVANKNINGAIRSVTAASVIDPTNPAIFFQLGLLKYNMGDFNGAIVALEKATQLTPNYANAKFFLGLSYEVTKQHEKAIKEFEDLKVSNPDSSEVDVILNNLKEGKPIFTDASTNKPEKGKELPLKENQ